METFLEEEGLLHLKDTFEENGIDSIDLMKELVHDKSFEEAVPRLGDRLKLKRKLFLAQKDLNEEIVPTSPKKIILDLPVIDVPSDVLSLASTSSIISNSIESCDVTPIAIVSQPTPEQHKKKNISNITIANNSFNLMQLLKSSLMGRAIVGLYNINGKLTTSCQSYLVEIIVQHLINIQPFRRLTNEDFRKLSKHIVEFFPAELEQVYFTSPIKKRNSKENKSGIARGKLVENEYDASLDEDLLWLIHNREPWGEVIERWSRTYEYRTNIIKQDIDFRDIVEKFPIIRSPLGYTLLDIDFRRKFHPQYQLIFKKFEDVFFKLLDLKKKNLNHGDLMIVELIQSKQLNIESRHYYMLTLLASLLPQKTFSKKSKNWYPTLVDAVNGVVVHIKIPSEIEETIENKRKILSKYNLPLLPFLIIQGTSISEIETIYVCYNDIIYNCESELKAVDICFQLIHLFNLRYPYESENIWMFIQIAIYNLKTPYDKIPNILDIANKCS